MLRGFVVLLAAALAFSAGDPWTKVKELKSGTEIRIYKRGNATPMMGKVDEVFDDRLSVVLKNEQVSVDKDSIERLDARPLQAPRKLTPETKTKMEYPDGKPPVGMNHGAPVPGASQSTSLTFGSKPDFETIYRRPPTKK
jgi:hypothetical protein